MQSFKIINNIAISHTSKCLKCMEKLASKNHKSSRNRDIIFINSNLVILKYSSQISFGHFVTKFVSTKVSREIIFAINTLCKKNVKSMLKINFHFR